MGTGVAGLGYNNALIENYTNAYRTMGFHSDQALDLQPGSLIALFSCYSDPELATPPRKLVVEPKEAGGGGGFEVPLEHNSVVVFSLHANTRFRHKIVLDAADAPENTWLGGTFRTSRTFVHFRDGTPRFEDGTPLALAGARVHQRAGGGREGEGGGGRRRELDERWRRRALDRVVVVA